MLGLVVLCTKGRNSFCPMCTKGCHTVLNRPNPFWGQFWEQIGEINSYPHRLNKCAALVSLQNWDTDITGFTHRKSPTNRYISFTLRQEVVRKYHATTAPHTAPVTARNASVRAHSRCISAVPAQPNTAQNFPLSRDFCFITKAFSGQRPRPCMPYITFTLTLKPLSAGIAASGLGPGMWGLCRSWN